jgi:hypothetical protein
MRVSVILGGFVEFWAISAQVRSQKHASFQGSWVGTEHYLKSALVVPPVDFPYL